jgi:hypothetical protein
MRSVATSRTKAATQALPALPSNETCKATLGAQDHERARGQALAAGTRQRETAIKPTKVHPERRLRALVAAVALPGITKADEPFWPLRAVEPKSQTNNGERAA